MSTDATTRTITCSDHPTRLTAAEARSLARHLLDEADSVSPRDSTLTGRQILLELDALRAKVTALAQVIDEHLPPSS